MKLSAILAPMIAAKADHAMILDTIIAWEAEHDDELEKRRQHDRERQARKRDRDAVSRDVTLRHSDRSLVRAGDARVEDITSSSVSNIPKTVNSASPAASAKTKRGARIPDDFEPDVDWGASQGLTRPQAVLEAAKFRDFWRSKPGQGGCKLDWPATWRNWVREAVRRLPQARAGPQPNLSQLYAVKERMERENDQQIEPSQNTVRYLPAANG